MSNQKLLKLKAQVNTSLQKWFESPEVSATLNKARTTNAKGQVQYGRNTLGLLAVQFTGKLDADPEFKGWRTAVKEKGRKLATSAETVDDEEDAEMADDINTETPTAAGNNDDADGRKYIHGRLKDLSKKSTRKQANVLEEILKIYREGASPARTRQWTAWDAFIASDDPAKVTHHRKAGGKGYDPGPNMRDSKAAFAAMGPERIAVFQRQADEWNETEAKGETAEGDHALEDEEERVRGRAAELLVENLGDIMSDWRKATGWVGVTILGGRDAEGVMRVAIKTTGEAPSDGAKPKEHFIQRANATLKLDDTRLASMFLEWVYQALGGAPPEEGPATPSAGSSQERSSSPENTTHEKMAEGSKPEGMNKEDLSPRVGTSEGTGAGPAVSERDESPDAPEFTETRSEIEKEAKDPTAAGQDSGVGVGGAAKDKAKGKTPVRRKETAKVGNNDKAPSERKRKRKTVSSEEMTEQPASSSSKTKKQKTSNQVSGSSDRAALSTDNIQSGRRERRPTTGIKDAMQELQKK
ncbi:hypothetical protein EIP91_004520 [Steccherinum ochraceum]|uniref:Uncharacterized protein n=1 Tax=Steccherinum ochraceum TaxID=92696 RepID=A0A4V2MVY7_9APHY|nr:hypothetical protein EIP91_004520 [Steccherinum ochraceum]